MGLKYENFKSLGPHFNMKARKRLYESFIAFSRLC